MFENVKLDLNRFDAGFRSRVRAVFLNPGTWAVLSYRLCRWLYLCRAPKIVKTFLGLGTTLLQAWIVVVTNIDLPPAADIGPGLFIPHTGFIVVAVGAKIGRNCTLTQGVTIGHAVGGQASHVGVPVIGDRVYVGPSVPAGGVVAGNPARVIGTRGSFDLISFYGMERDTERAVSIAALRPSLEAELFTQSVDYALFPR